ncbi:T9SS type A sorting domain-containing protein [Daejeonella sp.]|uniref:RCC1 domain-containing protein n=1 Tax=Daejeonella sp. TaxID=2805397 RepID=UPI0025C1B0FC|nr:T9SS type A sorting domain-containing protein [Daejeonella sp.]
MKLKYFIVIAFLFSSLSSSFAQTIASGYYHNLSIHQDGSLWSWGYNRYGQLGDGTTSPRTTPARIGNANDWKTIAAGYLHSVAIKSDGSLWTWGANGYGQLGDGSAANSKSPKRIGNATDWKMVGGGYNHTLAIKNDGSLWAWGLNNFGQLGDGTFVNKSIPTRIGNATDWKLISVGGNYTVAIKNDGSLWAWGYNLEGELGDATLTNKNIPTQIGTGTDWKVIKAGVAHTLAIKNDGSLWSWGFNVSGQLGDGGFSIRNTPARIGADTDWQSISSGYAHTLAIKNNGSLWAWGDNNDGQLGNGTTVDETIPTRIGTANNWALVDGGFYHTLTMKNNGDLWTWGYNVDGQLGNNSSSNKGLPLKVDNNDWRISVGGYNHTVAIKNDGSLWAWGLNTSGQLGDGTLVNKTTPANIGTDTDWKMLSAGSTHTLAIKNNGSLWSWGLNNLGQLGIGTNNNRSSPARIGTDTDWRSVSTGTTHTVAIKNDGSLWAWGANDVGQLGDGTFNYSYIPIRIGIDSDWQIVSLGASFTIAIKNDGSLWAWGLNTSGQLGDGTYINKNVPFKIGTDKDWQMVSAGLDHTLAIKNDGSLWAWGIYKGSEKSDGSNAPIKIGTDTDWQMISGGYSHLAAIKKDGSLWAWGFNHLGQLGDGTYNDNWEPTRIGTDSDWQMVSLGVGHTVATKSDGSLWNWGLNTYGQLGNGFERINPQPLDIDFNLIYTTPTPTGEASQPICSPLATISSLQATGTSIKWYDVASGGLPLAPSIPLVINKTYYASQTINGLESKSRLIVMVTFSLPTATITAGGPTSFCLGDKVTLTANAGSSYLWSTGATTQSIEVNTAGDYTVSVTNANGCSATSTATTVTVNPLPAATITAGGPISFCLGDKVTLTASAGSSYLWSTGATTQSIEVNSAGNYTVSVTSANGCIATSTATTVTVNPLPTATITAGGPTSFCLGDKVTLSASAGSSYLWSTGATTQSIEVNSAGNYTVSVTNANGCSATSTATTVTVNPLPTATITASGSTALCIGDKVILTSSEGSSYLWSTGATTRSIEVSTAGNYTVRVSNANGCSATSTATTVTVNSLPSSTITASGATTFCQGDKVTLTSSEGSSYLWSTGATTRSIEVSTSGNYSVRVSNANGCSVTSTATMVRVNSLPIATITAGGPTSFCLGDKVTLTASSGSSYLWSTGATTQSIEASTSGSYTVRVTNSNGCSATSAATTLTVNNYPAATITAGGPTTITQTGNVVLSANTGSSLNYQWIRNGVEINAATASSYTATTGGSYTVKVSNAAGCETLSSAMVIKSVLVLPANNYQINIQGETCRASDNGKIAISAVQNLNYTATLSKSGQVVKTVNFNTNADLTGLASGNYTLCLTVAGQTEYKQCFDLTITEPLDLSVYSKVNPTNNTIDLLMSGGDAYYITINGEKYTSYTSKMSLGLKAGLNKITVNSSQICQGLYTEEIYVDEKIQAYPNPFNSSLNLKIQNQENKELLVRVVDRYGLSVYEGKHLVINNLVTLDLSKLDNDYYFIVIGKQTFKVIKQ